MDASRILGIQWTLNKIMSSSEEIAEQANFSFLKMI